MNSGTRSTTAITLSLWIFLVLLFMVLAQTVNLEIFFVLWLIGLLVLTELTDTLYTLPRHLRYARYLIAVGVILFGILVARKVLEILGA